MLEALGLDAEAEEIYRLMLRQPTWGVQQICQAVNRPEEDVRAALDRLAGLSLLRPSAERSGLLSAVSPRLGLATVIAQRQAELVRQQRELDASQLAFESLIKDVAADRTDWSMPGIERLNGSQAIAERIQELAAEATMEALSFMPGGPQTPEALSAAKPLDLAVMKRGVQLRTLYVDAIRYDPGTLGYARWLVENGGPCRTVPALPVRMMIVDQKHALVSVNPLDGRRGALLLSEPGVVTALMALFEQYWATGADIDAPRPVGGYEPSPQERAALTLLARGLKDESIARQMGVSVRTARRVISEILSRLGADSRFQAGVLACKRGWL
jgi:DNA-binding CsgD family transcriptional regulator/sugar-specific transcriptional regulator TrmB